MRDIKAIETKLLKAFPNITHIDNVGGDSAGEQFEVELNNGYWALYEVRPDGGVFFLNESANEWDKIGAIQV